MQALCLIDVAEVAQAESLAEAVVQLAADGQALLQMGQRLAVLPLPVIAGAEVVVRLGLGAQVTHLASDAEGDPVCLNPVSVMAVHPKEPEQSVRELHPDLSGRARGDHGLPYSSY